MSLRVGMVSLGCSKNQIDAERMLYKIKEAGYELVGDAALADVSIINTCGFIQSAKEEAIETILEFIELKKEGRIKHVIITGCLAERYKEEILTEIPEADAVIGLGSNDDIVSVIKDVTAGNSFTRFGDKEKLCLTGGRIQTTLPFFAYLKIAEGCDNCCSYCAIPQIRGRFRSVPMEDIIAEAKTLAADGVKELIVIAQDTTRYGEDIYGESRLPELLSELCKIDELKWIRVLYCYPERITDKLLDVIAAEDKIVKYMDIPIQHCNEEILRNMNRGGSEAELRALITKIRKKVPGIILRTTLITGFPGETEEQFNELADFVSEMRFDRLGCFPYSPEEDTIAAEMDGQLDDETKQHRADIIMEQQMIVASENNEKLEGAALEVVVEGYDRYGECYFGRSAMDAPDIDGKIFFMSPERRLTMGDFVKVNITAVMDYDLIGEICDESAQ
ncbi:MAG: 30S ribosomal protein S12 methylthiotransferase RimO [Oscillospiraceae bacterium]|nr:30S ribosomal protein S12 methylthiotransferase RimO [Oscillospiraceae bacterium]